MRLDRSNNGGALPLPLAEEGWGEGVSAVGQSPSGESPHPALRLSRGLASAFFETTAAKGGLCLSRKRTR
ncbi:hypothetical protein DCG74_03015 [Bradyrhizobium sp. WBAH42]|nr:hypothetical protein [Bradyrhizobium sp. WBAH30]MDD1544082.1 hypothetical protein [Bradyrhizobium sp. WBAH41]MDD1560103.1 hypothetical protein [Bradyrhizobium sp. WBAH23]MDD1566692.1 hypothetical protein [Bradyrhizobium sp. WBAH33]MDD1593707.1 hypothetical protein [Bradyrhizobium sp. WBAH42]NRB89040.1 hypothetical protein [Bradyrhizobium sp. WBAH10]QCJ87482.1 hypothetical protein DAA57_02380 [Bradyrhizobium yuanmingense]